MTDCIPADAARELRERLDLIDRGMVGAPLKSRWAGKMVGYLDSLIAQARPCDEGLREALTDTRHVLQRVCNRADAYLHGVHRTVSEPVPQDLLWLVDAVAGGRKAVAEARTALAEEVP